MNPTISEVSGNQNNSSEERSDNDEINITNTNNGTPNMSAEDLKKMLYKQKFHELSARYHHHGINR